MGLRRCAGRKSPLQNDVTEAILYSDHSRLKNEEEGTDRPIMSIGLGLGSVRLQLGVTAMSEKIGKHKRTIPTQAW